MTQRRIAQTLEELPDMTELFSRSGEEFIRAILDGDLAGPPIGETLGFTLHDVSKGRVVFEGTPEFRATNPLRTVHGGWYGTILDSCMACAVQTTLPKGSTYTTLEYKINVVRSIPLGMTVHAVGTVQHVGRSTGVAVGELRGKEDGKLYATGSTTCIVMQTPKD
jgi:uncharacterized protein (TIGR00369 family)